MARVMSIHKDRDKTQRKTEHRAETLASLDTKYYQCVGCKSWQSRPRGA